MTAEQVLCRDAKPCRLRCAAAAWTYSVTLDVTDTAGAFLISVGTGDATAAIVMNLISNPGFEEKTAGWNGKLHAGITITGVAGGHSGDFVVEATNTTTMQPECPFNDPPNWLAATVAGTYDASQWVRADTPGNPVELPIRAYSDGTFVSSAESLVILDTAWQQLKVSYSPQVIGSTLDYAAYTWNAPPGSCFVADDASIGLSGVG